MRDDTQVMAIFIGTMVHQWMDSFSPKFSKKSTSDLPKMLQNTHFVKGGEFGIAKLVRISPSLPGFIGDISTLHGVINQQISLKHHLAEYDIPRRPKQDDATSWFMPRT